MLGVATWAVPLVAQVPTKCLEIESVLADACTNGCSGAQEGENEMFRFIIGPNPIPLGQITVQWATPNSFLGWVQNAASASLTAQLNATITQCGWLIEPPGGVIPAGRRVLGITSTDMCVAANSFSLLADTLYVIYQAAGNTFGHFKNTTNGNTATGAPSSPASFRTFIMRVTSPACSDSLTYNLSLMVNTIGTYGGGSAINDGSTIVADWPGTPTYTYVNFGCQAPITPQVAQIITQPAAVGCGANVSLSAIASGNIVSTFWSGGAGTFNPTTGAATIYTVGQGDSGGATLTFCAVTACGDTLCDQLQLNVLGAPTPSVTAPAPVPCGSAAQLSASISGTAASHYWQGGDGTWGDVTALSTTYTPAASEVGTVGLSFCAIGTCGQTVCATFNLDVLGTPAVTITPSGSTSICQGSTVTLTASGTAPVAWSSGQQTSSITVGTAGTYTVTATSACGQSDASIDVSVTATPVASIDGPATACPDEAITLTAVGGTGYQWTSGETTASIDATGPGTYAVTVTDICGTDQATLTVAQGTALQPTFAADITEGCSPLCVVLTADVVPDMDYSWYLSDGTMGSGSAFAHCFGAGDHDATLTVTPTGIGGDCPGIISMEDLVHAWPLPVARFSINPHVVTTENPEVFLVDESSGATEWTWDLGSFGDSTTTERSPVVVYDSVACYTITLGVVNEFGCTAATAGELCVEDPYSIWVPNAFTPNGDGVNDTFFAVTTVRDPEVYQLTVFDRWGGALFNGNAPGDTWDGADLPNGIYVWKIWIRDSRGFNHESIGHVSLLR